MESKTCCICFENSPDYYCCVFCNRGIVCHKCAEGLVISDQHHRCPLCRQSKWTPNLPSVVVVIEQSPTIRYTNVISRNIDEEDMLEERRNRGASTVPVQTQMFFALGQCVALTIIIIFGIIWISSRQHG